MFSFHKPKIYRSTHGCCICRAKSSSSRFTDSKKYEPEFGKCFRIADPRSRTGEICNACVLLVKRWKKLPAGTSRDWRHVVDARAGPGTKGSSKGGRVLSGKKSHHSKSNLTSHNKTGTKLARKDDSSDSDEDDEVLLRGTATADDDEALDDMDMDLDADMEDDDDDMLEAASGIETRTTASNLNLGIIKSSREASRSSSRIGRRRLELETAAASSNRTSRGSVSGKNRHAPKRPPVRRRPASSSLVAPLISTLNISPLLDNSFWKMEKICCGIIFKGPDDELLVCPQLLKPCACRKSQQVASASGTPPARKQQEAQEAKSSDLSDPTTPTGSEEEDKRSFRTFSASDSASLCGSEFSEPVSVSGCYGGRGSSSSCSTPTLQTSTAAAADHNNNSHNRAQSRLLLTN